MLVCLKSGADFSRGCAPPMIARTFLLTHPLKIREVTRAMPAHSIR
jgi:hypothetical protein